MAFIVGKKQGGKTYYYLAESARVEGRPRIVSQRYLGSAEEIAARLSEAGPGEPDRSRHLAFGDVAAVWEMLRRLRIAGLGLVVSTDGGVPLVSHAYPGNKPDVTQFGAMVEELVERFETLLPGGAAGDGEHLTLVYDAGQNSEDNYTTLDGAPLSFVGSLPPSDHSGLLAVSNDRYNVVGEEAF